MKIILKLSVAVILGMFFWVCIDAIQDAPRHIPYDLIDARLLWGLGAWLCAAAIGRIV